MDSIDLGRAFKAPFADKEWVKKTLLGFLWMLLGVTAPAVYGASLEYIKDVSEGRENLPEWNDFGAKWVKGFLLMVAFFIYMLPIWVVGLIFVLPGIIAGAASNGNSGGALFGGGMCLFSLFAIVYGVAVAILMYGAMVNYAMKGDFGSLFAFSEILGRVRDGSGYWAAWLWAIVVGFAASIISSVLSATGIGAILFPAVLYLEVMIVAHLFGQWAARSYGIAQVATPVGTPGYIPPAGTSAYAPPPPPAAPTYAPPAPPAAPAPPTAPAPAPQPEPAPPVAPPAYPAPPAAEPPTGEGTPPM